MIKRPPYKPINKFMNRIILLIKILATVRSVFLSSLVPWYFLVLDSRTVGSREWGDI